MGAGKGPRTWEKSSTAPYTCLMSCDIILPQWVSKGNVEQPCGNDDKQKCLVFLQYLNPAALAPGPGLHVPNPDGSQSGEVRLDAKYLIDDFLQLIVVVLQCAI